jgi:hypothetical protein
VVFEEIGEPELRHFQNVGVQRVTN